MMHGFARLFEILQRMGIAVTQEQIALFERYHAMLLDWNTRMDLTAVLDEDEMIDRHYADSASPLTGGWITQGADIADVGTGAGFPGIPIAILRPDVHMTLIDALEKRCAFLNAVVEALGLGCRVVHARAEDAGHDATMRGHFDVVLSRAVAPLPVLLEYTLPLAREGGCVLSFKGPGVQNEWEQGKRAAFLLGGRLEERVHVDIPYHDDWNHLLVPCFKQKPTPRAYPRKAGTPKKQPLG